MADSRGGTAEFWSPTQAGVIALGAAEAPRAWEMGTHSHRGATLLSSSSDSGSPAGAPPRPEMVKVHAAAAAHAFGCRSLHPALCSRVPFLARAEPTSTQGNTHIHCLEALSQRVKPAPGPGLAGRGKGKTAAPKTASRLQRGITVCLCMLCLVAWQPGLGRQRAAEEGSPRGSGLP